MQKLESFLSQRTQLFEYLHSNLHAKSSRSQQTSVRLLRKSNRSWKRRYRHCLSVSISTICLEISIFLIQVWSTVTQISNNSMRLRTFCEICSIVNICIDIERLIYFCFCSIVSMIRSLNDFRNNHISTICTSSVQFWRTSFLRNNKEEKQEFESEQIEKSRRRL